MTDIYYTYLYLTIIYISSAILSVWELRCSLLLRFSLLLLGLICFFEKAFAPIDLRLLFLLFFWLKSCLLLVLDLFSFFLSNVCLVGTDLFIFFLCAAINLAGSLITGFTHLRPHYLAKCTCTATIRKHSLRLFINFFFWFNEHSLDVRWLQRTWSFWLTLDRLKLLENFAFTKKSCTSACENVYHVVNLDTLVQNTRHQVFTVGCPVNADCTVWFCLSYLIRLFGVSEVPEVHLPSQVSKSSNHRNLREGAYLDSVPVPFSKLKKWVAIFVI